MLTIDRALMSSPTMLVLDEPSFGLPPMRDPDHRESINRERKVAVLLVEQNARMALAVAARAYVMETGRIVPSGPAPRAHEPARQGRLPRRMMERLEASP
jgi:branched-chain amino acid transport system ATP-binding protein